MKITPDFNHSPPKRQNKIVSVFERLVTWFASDETNLNQRERAAKRMLIYISLITIVFSLFYMGVNAWIDLRYGIPLMLLNFIFLWLGLFLVRYTGSHRLGTHLYLANCTFVAIFGCSFFSGGLHSPVTPWFTLIPVAAVLLLGYSFETLLWVPVACAVPIGYGVAGMLGYQFPVSYLQEYSWIYSTMCIVGLVLILFLLALTFDHNRNQAMKELVTKNKALDRAREQAERATRMLEKLATIDALTSVPNRRAFDMASAREWRRCRREQLPISFVMIDIDQFKQYNDTFGHGAGDECLIRVARALNGSAFRPGDLVARYGGEEFAAILYNTSADDALHVVQRFHGVIAALAIPHAPSATHPIVTISIGVATTTRTSELTLEDLAGAADRMLYKSKQSGRNMTQATEI